MSEQDRNSQQEEEEVPDPRSLLKSEQIQKGLSKIARTHGKTTTFNLILFQMVRHLHSPS